MEVIVNGERREVTDASTVTDLVSAMGRDRAGTGVAVAVNGEVISRSTWDEHVLDRGDRIEVLSAVAGG